MDFRVLDKSFRTIAIIDNFKSLMWCKRYNEVGAIDLQIEASVENLRIFKRGNYIARDDDDTIYRIEAIEIDTDEEKDNSLIIGGFDIKRILEQRVIYNTETYNTTVENVIRNMITNNFINPDNASRRISNFALKTPRNFNDEVSMQLTYNNVGEEINSLCKTYNYGYKVTLEDGMIYFDLFKGKDKSSKQSTNPRVVFSTEYENINSSKYTLDTSEYRNVALIGGEGEGSDRKKAETGTAEGLDRFEIFVDASSVSSDDGKIDAVEYKKLLIEKGKEGLSENIVTTTFEAVVDTNLYKYKEDFDLGDIVTISNEYGISVDARITEIIETWDESGYTLEPKFEYEEVEEFDVDTNVDKSLLTEDGVMLLANSRSVPLLMEDSMSSTGIKISELDAATELYDGCCLPIVQNGETKKITFEVLREEIIDNLEIPETSNMQLSDIETLSLSTTDTVMPYDGFISVYWSGSSGMAGRQLIVNDIVIGAETSAASGYTNSGGLSYLVKQGDRVRVSSTNLLKPAVVRWFKEDLTHLAESSYWGGWENTYLDSTGETFTAPEDGVILVTVKGNSGYLYAEVTTATGEIFIWSVLAVSGGTNSGQLHVNKGDTVKVTEKGGTVVTSQYKRLNKGVHQSASETPVGTSYSVQYPDIREEVRIEIPKDVDYTLTEDCWVFFTSAGYSGSRQFYVNGIEVGRATGAWGVWEDWNSLFIPLKAGNVISIKGENARCYIYPMLQ